LRISQEETEGNIDIHLFIRPRLTNPLTSILQTNIPNITNTIHPQYIFFWEIPISHHINRIITGYKHENITLIGLFLAI